MTVYINGTTGYSGPVGTIGDLTTTGNTTLGDASGDTLTLNGNTASIPNGLNFTNGNIGIGATPSAWGGSYKVLQLTGGNIGAFSTTAITTFQNAYDSGVGSYVYLTTAAASRYTQSQGQHQWFNAPSGTAGATATFTQAMTLDASGRLVVNGTSPNSTTVLTLQESASLSSVIAFKNRNANQTWAIAVDAMAVDDKDLGFLDVTNSTMRMILSDSGNLGLGVAPNAWASVRPAIQIGGYGTNLSAYNGGGGATNLSHNAYHNGTDWVRQIAYPAALYVLDGTGGHTWYTATTGSANTTISFATSMTLNTSSNLGVTGSVTSTGFITSGAYGAQATLGSGVTSWAGSAYPTLYGSSTERWVMHMNPHICYTVNGTNGYTGSMTGATIRYGGTPTYGSSWDVGIGCGGVGSDTYTINRENVNLYKMNSSGQGFFTQGNSFIDFGPNTTWSAKLRVGGNGNNDTSIATVCATNGNLHIDAAAAYGMYLNYYSGSAGVGVFNGAGNGGYGTIRAAAFTVSSDYRLKENIVEIADGALASVLALSPKEYDLAGYDTRRFYGFLAHELAEHLPITVVGEKDAVAKDGKPDYQGVEYMQLVPVLVKALQELDAKFEAYRLTHP